MKLEEIKGLIIGLPIAEARSLLSKHGFFIRVIIEDGKELIWVSDIRMNRVNILSYNGVVSSVYSVG